MGGSLPAHTFDAMPNQARNKKGGLKMRIRYLSYILLGVLAAFVVVATQVFPLPTVEAIALGVGIAMIVVSLRIADRFNGDLWSLAIGATAAVVSAWIVLSTQVFPLATMQDVTFYSAIAVGALALAGLTAHELRAERVVHSLEVRSDERQPEPADSGRPLAA
jgi:hypothetical protein